MMTASGAAGFMVGFAAEFMGAAFATALGLAPVAARSASGHLTSYSLEPPPDESPPLGGVARAARLRDPAPPRRLVVARLAARGFGVVVGDFAAAGLRPRLAAGLAATVAGLTPVAAAFGGRPRRAGVPAALFAVARVAVVRFAVAGSAAGLRPDLLAFGAELELADDAAAPPPRSSVHFPDSTRCAASATASAINVPSLDALFITDVAALVALSAASSPASRILRRAVGLAARAAAAAVNPAASISRLTATFAIRSMVVSLLVDFPPDFVVSLAMHASRENVGS
jgi:hypothetical protein